MRVLPHVAELAVGTRPRMVLLTTAVLVAGVGLREYAAAAASLQGFRVNSTADQVDAAPGDGRCATAAGRCTLRAAFQEVAALPSPGGDGHVIELPSGLYRLTIPAGGELTSAEPVVAAGDLDVTTRVTLAGAGANRAVIDGNGAHRVLDVHGSPQFPDAFAKVSGVSLRNGRAERSGPSAHVHGGAIHNHGALELLESTVSDSVADAGSPWGGGGITNAGSGSLVLRNVTIANNRTTYFGGGIENGGPMTVDNVTISANTAPEAQGPGISSGVGFFGGSPSAEAQLRSTIVSGNGFGGNNCADRPSPTINSLGTNLQTGGACPFLHPTDPAPADPLLEAVEGSRGSIFVYELSEGSPAIDRSFTCPPTDERGVTRPQEGDGVEPALCDIGAYELEP